VTVHQDYETTGDVFAPARAFNQVLLNLVDNSIRSGAENIWIELRQVDKQVSVAVADDGPGVPADVVHRIFDPFFTTRVEGEGTGLGLHLSRRIAQECGGELRYEPRPGGGARFVMEIPAMEQAA
jgi:signal transduction histidine kinase